MKKNFFRFFLVCVVCMVSATEIEAQDIPNIKNLQDLDVDQLTDEQIQKFIDQVESSGYTEQQLEILAKARGMSSVQITKLRQRIYQLRGRTITKGNSSSISRSRISPELDYNRTANEEDLSTFFDPFATVFPDDTLQEKDELEIFGLSFFKNRNLTFEPSLNIATPKNYVIGAGDQIIIDVWGASEQTYQLDVSPEGSIIIPSIGPIYLNGLTVERAESRIKTKLKTIYSKLGDNTFAQISLGQIRTISVNVVGEVAQPGTYQMSSFGTAFNALYLAGGPNEDGSLREIQVFRGGQKVATLDAYNFLIYGEGQNTMLQDQDVLLVKPYQNRITVKGEVKRPAYYETKKEETLGKAIEFAGGFTASAYTRSISVRRNLDNRKTIETVSKENFGDFALQGGDELEVDKIRNQFVNRIRIEGAVNHPGEFQLPENLKLSEALQEMADGLRADAFLNRGVIIRQNQDLSLSNIAFSPQAVVNGQENVLLQSEDLIKIQSIFDLREDYTVSIEGEVLDPGVYAYAEGMTVGNLIFMARGFKETAASSFVEVARRVRGENQSGEDHSAEIFNFPVKEDLSLTEGVDFVLEPFDLVVIRRSPYYEKQAIVEVEGEVKYPGKYVLRAQNERISDVLKRAGGMKNYAYLKGATLVRRTEYYTEKEEETLTDFERVNAKLESTDTEDVEQVDEATRIRREELEALFQRDTSLLKAQKAFKQQESIGIELEEILKHPGSKYDLILKEGDVISIPRQLQTVRVRGEVLYPSTIRYDQMNSVRSYISLAGGFTDGAKKSKVYVVYPNGSAERTKHFLWFKDFPRVEPGTEIIIPAKPPKQRLSPQAIVSLTSGIATLSLVIVNLINQL